MYVWLLADWLSSVMSTRVDAPSQPLIKVIAEAQETSWRWSKLRESGFTTNINYTISSQHISWITLSIKYDHSKRWVFIFKQTCCVHNVFCLLSVNEPAAPDDHITAVCAVLSVFGVKLLLCFELHAWEYCTDSEKLAFVKCQLFCFAQEVILLTVLIATCIL